MKTVARYALALVLVAAVVALLLGVGGLEAVALALVALWLVALVVGFAGALAEKPNA